MDHLPNYEKELRPWGNFERFTLNEETTVKIITISPEEELSLQTHAHRSEFWRILSGYGTITLGDEELEAHAGDEFFIPQESKHRAHAGPDGLVLLEIAFGTFEERDEVLLTDKYNRA